MEDVNISAETSVRALDGEEYGTGRLVLAACDSLRYYQFSG